MQYIALDLNLVVVVVVVLLLQSEMVSVTTLHALY